MELPTSFAALPAPEQWLIRRLQDVAFGRLTFCVRGGSPDPSSGFRVSRTRKLFGGDNGARPQAYRDDFAIRDEHVALIKQIRSLADGTRVTVRIALGLPTTSFDIEEDHKAA